MHYDETNYLKEQYADAGNYNRRVWLASRFSTNSRDFASWVFDQIEFPPKARVLELGCGPGYLWLRNTDRLPAEAAIVLSDFSAGMLEVAKDGLKDYSETFDFAVVDAQEIPFANHAFDIAVANHMLYHVPDRKKALAEIRRVLKPGGTLYATTIGLDNFREIRELFRNFFNLPPSPGETVAGKFGLENGYGQLSGFFEHIQLEKYMDHLEVTEAQPIVDYLMSAGSPRLAEFMTPERISSFKDYLERLIEGEGHIYVTKESGLFIAR